MQSLRACAWIVMVTLARVCSRADDSSCLECHGDSTLARTNASGVVVSLFVDEPVLRASVHRTNACVTCHANVTAEHPNDEVPVKPAGCSHCHTSEANSHEASVHGQTGGAGTDPVASCADCHGTHSILPSTSPASALHFTHVNRTCGECHPDATADVEASVHGEALRLGHREAPTCIDCHVGHNIAAFKDASALQIALEVCGRCHASERINTRFRLPRDRVTTFFASYHGLASRFGNVRVAHCGSCHGYHLVLPQTNPRSAVHPDRLAGTCGKCHRGASRNFVRGRIHVDVAATHEAVEPGARINRLVRDFYLVVITVCIGFMAAHNALVLVRKAIDRRRCSHPAALRMDKTQRWQHMLLVLSFVVLAVSGFALRYPGSWISHLLFDSDLFRRWLHRSAGLVLLCTAGWHLCYVILNVEGRRLCKDLLPGRKDAAGLIATLRMAVGRQATAMVKGRFGYAEKIEYWAVVWGTIIMGITGLALWLKMEVTQWLPRWALDVAGTVHYYEAVLATLAIVVWHLYHVIFDPDVYPMNWAWLDGYVSGRPNGNGHLAEDSSPESAHASKLSAGQADN